MIDETSTSQPSQSERLLSAFAHVSILIPHIGFIVPSLIWIIQVNQKNKSQYLAFQSLQAMIFQVSIIIFGFIIYVATISSINVIHTLFPIFIASIIKFILIVYGIIGAVITFQGKNFRYWMIGNQTERFMPEINLKPSKIYIALIVFILMNVLVVFTYFLLAMMD